MRVLSLMILLLVLGAGAAGAVVDPEPDILGVYFDQNGDQTDTLVGPSIPFFAYVLLTNPAHPEIWGFEFGYEITVYGPETAVFRLASSIPPGSIDLGYSDDILQGDHVVGLAAPLPAQPAVVLATWQYMLLQPLVMHIQLGPSAVESIPDGLPAYEIGGTIVPLGLAETCGLPGSARVNEVCPLAEETQSFGAVKALYR